MNERDVNWAYTVKDRMQEKLYDLRLVRWARRKVYNLRRMLKIWCNWERYEEIIERVYSPWVDISEGTEMLYMSHPDNLYCGFCGCKFVRFDSEEHWGISGDEYQNHSATCLWHKIDQLRYL